MIMPAMPPIVMTVPISPLCQPCASRNTPRNGPMPACKSAMKKFSVSSAASPRGLFPAPCRGEPEATSADPMVHEKLRQQPDKGVKVPPLGSASGIAAKNPAAPLRIELGVPIQIIEPALVQIVGREQPAVAVQLVHGRREWRLPRKHPRLLRRQVALAQVTRRTRRNHVLPRGLASLAAGDDVVEGEIVVGRAILADEAVAQEHVEPGKGGMRGRLDEGFQRHDAGQLNLERGTAHRAVVMLDDIDAVEKHRLDRVLPRPKRQRIITERPEVRVQYQYRPTAL